MVDFLVEHRPLIVSNKTDTVTPVAPVCKNHVIEMLFLHGRIDDNGDEEIVLINLSLGPL